MENNETFEKVEFVDSTEELQQAIQNETSQEAQPQAEPAAEPQAQQEAQPAQQEEVATPEATEEPAQQQTEQVVEEPIQDSPSYSEKEIETAVYTYLSERLGREINSFDELNIQQNALDERIEVISDFVSNTGRDPSDWFAYQSLNTSEMDDMTAIRVDMASKYENLAPEEVGMLINSKYKLDEDLHSEEEVKLSRLQMKIDGQAAKQEIEKIRSEYAAPEVKQKEEEVSYFNDKWKSDMKAETETLNGLEFDLGNGNTFAYGLDDQYRNSLVEKNSNLDTYFDKYIRKDGSWDHDSLNSQMAVLDNIDAIVSNAYKQGLGDGQKGLVEKAANVGVSEPNPNTGQPNVSPISEQLKNIIVGDKMTFKI